MREEEKERMAGWRHTERGDGRREREGAARERERDRERQNDTDTWFIVKATDPYTRREWGGG